MRNKPCKCGSGLKYKLCCWVRDSKMEQDMVERENRAILEQAAHRLTAHMHDELLDGVRILNEEVVK